MIRQGCLLMMVCALAACGGGTDDPAAAGTGGNGGSGSGSLANLTLRLTDAPGDLVHAWVEVTGVILEGEDENDQPISESIFVGSTGLVDLLTLADTTTDVVIDRAVPAGRYQRMIVEFGDVVLETRAGVVIALPGSAHPMGATIDEPLECSTCNNGNPNVAFPDTAIDLAAGESVLVLDFDVRQSFGRRADDPRRWFMRPVIYAVDESNYGAILGTVTLDAGITLPVCGGRTATLEDFIVTAYERDDSPHSGRTMPNGSYRINYLPPGTYGMIYHPELSAIDFDDEQLVFNAIVQFSGFPIQVDVPAGSTATMDYLINAVGCVQRPPMIALDGSGDGLATAFPMPWPRR